MNDRIQKEHTAKHLVVLYILLGIFLGISLWAMLFPERADYDHMVRSSSLRLETRTLENVSIATYMDQNWKATYADNLMYSSVRRTRDGNTVLEEYLDVEGNPARQSYGYYAIRKEYNDLQQNVKSTYLDAEGQPMMTTAGYSTLVRTYNADGRLEKEVSYGVDGQPAETQYNAYGHRHIYDEEGRNITTTYLDANGQIMKNRSGYAILKMIYPPEEEGAHLPERLYFYDEQEQPIALIHGEYGVHRGYDGFGRITEVTYLDQQGAPMMIPEGYATIRRTFYEDDSIRTEMYFDTAGQPVELSQGQFGILHEGDKITYLDQDGEEIFRLKAFISNQPWLVMVAAFSVVLISFCFGRGINIALLICYLAGIGYMTLLRRSEGSAEPKWELFWSYRQFFADYSIRKEIVDNIWLFLPLGAILMRLRHLLHFQRIRIPVVILLPALLSTAIELTQYVFHRGTFELDDIFGNTLGGAVGIAFGYIAAVKIWKRRGSGIV